MSYLVTEPLPMHRSRINPLFATLVLVIFIFLAFLTGVRDASTGTDTEVYSAIYAEIQKCNCLVDGIEPAFGAFALLVGYLGSPVSIFFALVAAAQFFLIFFLCVTVRRFAYQDAKGEVFQLLAFSFVLASPFFLNAQVNVIRQGLSAPLTLLSAIYFLQRRNWAALVFGGVAMGMHYSSALFLIFFPLLRVSKKSIYIFFAALVLAYISGLTEGAVRFFSDLFGLPIYAFFQDYGADTDYRRGVRYDFLIFSLFPIALSSFMKFAFKSSLFTSRIDSLERIYLLFLMPFLMVGWGGFSDRYLLNAWLFFPILIAMVAARFISAKGVIFMFGMVLASAGIYAYALGKI